MCSVVLQAFCVLSGAAGLLCAQWCCRPSVCSVVLQAFCVLSGAAGLLCAQWCCRPFVCSVVPQAFCVLSGAAGLLWGWLGFSIIIIIITDAERWRL